MYRYRIEHIMTSGGVHLLVIEEQRLRRSLSDDCHDGNLNLSLGLGGANLAFVF